MAGLLATCFALVIAEISILAGIGIILAAFTCGHLGMKDWSSGRKLIGGLFCAFAAIIGLSAAGLTLAGTECWQDAATEAALEECRNNDATATASIQRMSFMALILLFANPILGWLLRKRLQAPGSFAARYGTTEVTKISNRWFTKEKAFETFVIEELSHAGISERQLYEWICDVRGIAPERFDSGARYDRKARELLEEAPWQSVYDLVERCWPFVGYLYKEHFERRVNEHLRDAQVGWLFANAHWTRVGDEIGEENFQRAADACNKLGAEDARRDLENAWKLCNELGEGYKKEAVASATRALERIVQERTGHAGVNLNRIKWDGPSSPHEKIRGVINSLYSYSSDQARHANKGANIAAKDAHFVVSVCTILVIYLAEECHNQ